MIAAVEAGEQPVPVGRVPNDGVEIDDGVPPAAGADPVVDRRARGLVVGGVVRGAAERQDGDPVRADAGLVRFELKHLFLRPSVRGRGYGGLLLAELERRAVLLGAEEIVLDTNASLESAGALYRRAGYSDIAAYNANPNATNWYGKPLVP